MTITAQQIHDPQQWDVQIKQFETAHILQSWAWGEFKQRTTGWSPERLLLLDAHSGEIVAAASLLTRKVGPLRVMYIPKGPVFADGGLSQFAEVLGYFERLARQRLAIWLKIDPDIIAARGLPSDAGIDYADRPDRPEETGQHALKILKDRNWRFSEDQIQFRNTFYLDLTQSEDDILRGMNQSTRRKIRKSEKSGVVIREAATESDLRALYEIYAVTGERQDFLIRPWDYYRDLWQSFQAAGLAHILLAEVDDTVIGGIVLLHFGQRVWYFYGMSSNQYREYNANHALQWTAIRWAKSQGYQLYDWWGAPDQFDESDPMWGVYQFKHGFGGDVVRHIGAWDYTPFAPLYFAYTRLMPAILSRLR